jgi:hypothetical protein
VLRQLTSGFNTPGIKDFSTADLGKRKLAEENSHGTELAPNADVFKWPSGACNTEHMLMPSSPANIYAFLDLYLQTAKDPNVMATTTSLTVLW